MLMFISLQNRANSCFCVFRLYNNTPLQNNMMYEGERRIKEEDIVHGVSKTFSEDDEDLSSCSSSSLSSSSDITEDEDDASSFSSNGPLEDLSDLMSHLPIKRGLSKFYEGRSQSFTSLANVKSLEDLMKRGFQNKGTKSCRSSGMILEKRYKRVYSTKAKISKKPNKTPTSTLSCLSRRRN